MSDTEGTPEIHPVYSAFRAGLLLLSIPMFILYSIQVYRDRASAFKLDGWRPVHTQRVFRLAGLLGTFLMILWAIDTFGAFGIYGVGTRFFWGISALTCWFVPTFFAVYQAIKATVAFVPNYDHIPKIRNAYAFLTVFNWLLQILSPTVPMRWPYQLMLLTGAVSLWFIIGSVNWVYFKLRAHHREMSAQAANEHLASLPSIEKVVKKWRIYAIAVSIILLLLSLGALNGFLSFTRDTARQSGSDSFRRVSDPTVRPGFGRMSISITYTLILYAMLWRCWQKKPAAAGKTFGKGASGTDTSSTGTKSAMTHHRGSTGSVTTSTAEMLKKEAKHDGYDAQEGSQATPV